MKNHIRWMIVFILFLALSTLACQALFGEDESETQVEDAVTVQAIEVQIPEEEPVESVGQADIEPTAVQEQPTEVPASPTPEEEPPVIEETEEAEPEELDSIFSVPEEPTSYRLAFSMSIFGSTDADSEPAVVITGEGAITNEPVASSLSFNISGIEGAETFSDMTMIQLDDQTYFTLPTGDCLSGLFSQEDFPFEEITQGSDYVQGISEAMLVERNVEINGVMTNHYSFDQSSLSGSGLFDESMEEFEGNLFISEEGHLIRIAFTGLGSVDIPGSESLDGGRLSYQLDFFDINEPIDITLPDACTEAGATDLPIVSDAFELNTIFGITSYKSNLSSEEIVEFYRSEMAAAGWILDSEIAAGTSVMMSYSLEGETALITVDEDTDSDARMVSIIEQ